MQHRLEPKILWGCPYPVVEGGASSVASLDLLGAGAARVQCQPKCRDVGCLWHFRDNLR